MIATGAAIAAGASLLGSALSGLFGSKSTKSTNKTNYAIAQEQNALNYRMFNEQNAFNEKMWNLTNEYNSPANQRARYEAAGLNPYFAMQNIQGGNASSLMSAQAQPAQGAQMQPVDYSFLGQMVPQAVQAALTESQTTGNNIENDYKPAMFALKMRQLSANIQNSFADTSLKHMVYKIQKAGFNATVQSMYNREYGERIDNANKILQGQSISIQNQINSFFRDKIQPQEAENLAVQFNQIVAQTYVSVTQGHLNEEKAKSEAINRIATMLNAKANLINANANKQNADTNSLVGSATVAKLGSETSLNRQKYAQIESMFADSWNLLRNQSDYWYNKSHEIEVGFGPLKAKGYDWNETSHHYGN